MPRADRACVALTGVASRREKVVFVRRRAETPSTNSPTPKSGALKAAGHSCSAARSIQPAPDRQDLGGNRLHRRTRDQQGRHAAVAAVHVLGRAISAIDLKTNRSGGPSICPGNRYRALLSRDGGTLERVAGRSGAKVLALDPETLETKAEVSVGEHPNVLALSQDGTRLFVACANTNKVWALDLPALTAREQVSVALFPNAPAGTTPNALAGSPDGETRSRSPTPTTTPSRSSTSGRRATARSKGSFPPAGIRPPCCSLKDGKRLFVLNGKGLTGQANPRGPCMRISSTAEGLARRTTRQGRSHDRSPAHDGREVRRHVGKARPLVVDLHAREEGNRSSMCAARPANSRVERRLCSSRGSSDAPITSSPRAVCDTYTCSEPDTMISSSHGFSGSDSGRAAGASAGAGKVEHLQMRGV